MELLNFFKDDPVMGWFALIALLVTVVPVASVLWSRLFGRKQAEAIKQFERDTKSTHFGNRTDITLLIIGFMLLLAFIGWVYGSFFR